MSYKLDRVKTAMRLRMDNPALPVRYDAEDVALILADPSYAESLGIELPTCWRCGGVIRNPPSNWDGGPVEHPVPAVGDQIPPMMQSVLDDPDLLALYRCPCGWSYVLFSASLRLLPVGAAEMRAAVRHHYIHCPQARAGSACPPRDP